MSAPGHIDSFSVAHLPIVEEYAHRMGLMEIIDMPLSCGIPLKHELLKPGSSS
jgi:hypothetical protein